MKSHTLSCAGRSLVAVIIISFSFSKTSAQSLEFPLLETTRLGLEVMKPNFEGSNNISTISSIWYFDIQAPLGFGKWAFIGEIPLAIFDVNDYQSFFGTNSFDAQIMLGNLLIAMEYRSSPDGLGGYARFGVRPPLSSEDDVEAAIYGIYTDFDRFDAFVPNQFTLLGGGGWRGELSRSVGSSTQFHFGVTGMGLMATEDNVDSEVFLKYHAQFWYLASKFSGHFGYSGVALITESDLDLGERTESQLTLGIRGNFGNVSPGAFIRFPVEEDLSQINSFVGGVNLLINLPGKD